MSSNAVYKVVCLDMDGTTLNSNHELSDRTINALRKIARNGHTKIYFVSGRSFSNMYNYIKLLDLPQEVNYVVAYNGSWCVRLDRNLTLPPTTMFSTFVKIEYSSIIIDMAKKLDLVVQYYNANEGKIYAVPTKDEHYSLLDKYSSLVNQKQTFLASYDEALNICESAKLLVFTYDVDALLEYCKEHQLHDIFHIIRGSPDPYFVEFLPLNVTKGSAIKALASLIDVDVKEMVAMGDGDNDVEMIECVGLGIAVKNAKDVLKATASYTSEYNNDEDAVAIELERLLSEGKIL